MANKSTHERLTDYQPTFSELARRAENGRVDTRYGRQIFDAELREPYEDAEANMNRLLEQYFVEMSEVQFIQVTDGLELITDEPSGLLVTPTEQELEDYGS